MYTLYINSFKISTELSTVPNFHFNSDQGSSKATKLRTIFLFDQVPSRRYVSFKG